MRALPHSQERITFGPIWPVTITERAVSLSELFWVFFKIGAISFGGFMALVSATADAFVDKKKLLTHEEMLDGMSLANLLPGPRGINCVVYVGYRLRGGLGAWVSAIGALLPSLIWMVSLTTLYVIYASQLPALNHLLAAVLPAVAAIIVAVAYRMGRKVLQSRREAVFALLAALLFIAAPQLFRPYATMAIVLGSGLAGWYLFRKSDAEQPLSAPHLPRQWWLGLAVALGVLGGACITALAFDGHGLLQIALTFGGLSLMLFGSGYVLVPMIFDAVVSNAHWLTTEAFLDGLALSQVTPGPVLLLAAFIGQHVMAEQYGLLYGIAGALVATFAIFAPPAVLMVVVSNTFEEIKPWPSVRACLRGIRCGVLGMISVAALAVFYAGLPAWPSGFAFETLWTYFSQLGPALVIFSAALAALTQLRIGAAWILTTAGLIGLVLA